MHVDRVLTDLAADFPGVSIERVDIVTSPLRAWQNGIRMIPALQSNERTLSGLFLRRADIRAFLEHIQGNE